MGDLTGPYAIGRLDHLIRMTTVIDLIRHGTPEGGNRYRGNKIDDPLSDKGWQQMWSAVEGFSAWDAVVTSPMQRCVSFARAYADNHQLNVEVIEDLKEVGFGEWEGKSSREILADNPDVIKNFYRDPITHRPAGAEGLDNPRLESTILTHRGILLLTSLSVFYRIIYL